MTPFVAPDESYLAFARDERAGPSPSGRTTKDLFISVRLKGDVWSEAVELGPGINVPGVEDICPMVSPDGKYLFFVSRRINREFRAHWVDAAVIEDLRRRHANGVVR
jgi:Tol biopolymer transport system component